MSLIKDSLNNNTTATTSTIDDNNMFALSFANHPMDLISNTENPPDLLDSNNNGDSFHEDFIMDLDTYNNDINNNSNNNNNNNYNPTIITPKVNFITGGFENYDVGQNMNNREIESKNQNNLLSSTKGSYENIIDSYANVAQQNYRLWLSSF